jgi:hypothetical protein
MAKAEQETAVIFALANAGHPAMQELMRLSTLRRLRDTTEGTHGS